MMPRITVATTTSTSVKPRERTDRFRRGRMSAPHTERSTRRRLRPIEGQRVLLGRVADRQDDDLDRITRYARLADRQAALVGEAVGGGGVGAGDPTAELRKGRPPSLFASNCIAAFRLAMS